MEQMKPCPFCGQEPHLDKCISTVKCRNCLCKSPLVGKVLTEEERKGLNEWEQAIRAWNKRA
jgi:hypothetical protein